MTSIRVDKFAGMVPRLSIRGLPDMAASIAKNTRLTSGDLRGLKQPLLLHEFAGPNVKSAYRAVDTNGDDVWMSFTNVDVDVARAPLVNDSLLRYYWTGDEDYIAYLEADDINTGTPYRLGTPAPTAAPSLAVSGGSGSTETRSYVYTFLNDYGEESAPSPPVTVSGFINGSWNLTALQTSGSDMTNRNPLDTKRIYRTVTGQSSVEYYFVAEIVLATASYNDTITSAVVVLNSVLQSFDWAVPPDDLLGLTAHPGGFLCAFRGRDLHFSEPYRPHAWPAAYVLSLEFDVVGLAIYNNTLVALTTAHPYFIAGSKPINLSPIKSQSIEPCIAKGSIAATLSGVLYASPNGLVLFNENGPTVVSAAVLTKEEWAEYAQPELRAAQYDQRYLAFYDDMHAFMFTPAEPFGVFFTIDRFTGIDNVLTDKLNGDVWLVSDDKVFQWEPATGDPLYYTWRSKEYDFTRPINFGAFITKFDGFIIDADAEYVEAAEDYNIARIQFPLDPFNWSTLATSRDVAMTPVNNPLTGNAFPQNKQTQPNGSPLFNIGLLSSIHGHVQLTVWADRRLVYQGVCFPSRTQRLPSGFKAHVWQFELIGNAAVYSFAMAETARELRDV